MKEKKPIISFKMGKFALIMPNSTEFLEMKVMAVSS